MCLFSIYPNSLLLSRRIFGRRPFVIIYFLRFTRCFSGVKIWKEPNEKGKILKHFCFILFLLLFSFIDPNNGDLKKKINSNFQVHCSSYYQIRKKFWKKFIFQFWLIIRYKFYFLHQMTKNGLKHYIHISF